MKELRESSFSLSSIWNLNNPNSVTAAILCKNLMMKVINKYECCTKTPIFHLIRQSTADHCLRFKIRHTRIQWEEIIYLHLPRHQIQKLGEIDCAILISINFTDHVLQFSLSGILSQRSHHSSQLFGSDATYVQTKTWIKTTSTWKMGSSINVLNRTHKCPFLFNYTRRYSESIYYTGRKIRTWCKRTNILHKLYGKKDSNLGARERIYYIYRPKTC